jgi:transposase-like protein
MSNNFQPAVKCPHCGVTRHPEVSGWGGEFSTRTHHCKSCGKDYVVILYATASTDLTCTTLNVNDLKRKIDHYKKSIIRMQAKLTEHNGEWAREFIRVEASSRGNQN